MGNPMMEAAVCPLCGMGWCGRPCLRDPRKSNALLFKKDGREKTLKERGLGWDDPPPMLVVPMRKVKLLPAPKAANAVSNKPANTVNKPANTAKPDRKAYMRELMRKKRAAAKTKKGKPQDFKG